jgi:hypothetical protein
VLSHTCSVVNQALRCSSPSVEDLSQSYTVQGKRLADSCCVVRLQTTQQTEAPRTALSHCKQYKERTHSGREHTAGKRWRRLLTARSTWPPSSAALPGCMSALQHEHEG